MADRSGACTPSCWTPASCEHGTAMPPRGRSVPLGVPVCCDQRHDPRANPRHLWDEHDPERWRFDPAGLIAHQGECDLCRPDDEAKAP